MEGENIPHYSENVAFQLEWQRLDDLVHENNGGDADDHDNDRNDINENNESHEGENDDGNGNQSIDFAIENQAPQTHVNLSSQKCQRGKKKNETRRSDQHDLVSSYMLQRICHT